MSKASTANVSAPAGVGGGTATTNVAAAGVVAGVMSRASAAVNAPLTLNVNRLTPTSSVALARTVTLPPERH